MFLRRTQESVITIEERNLLVGLYEQAMASVSVQNEPEKQGRQTTVLSIGTGVVLELSSTLSECDQQALCERRGERRGGIHVYESEQLTGILKDYMRRKLLRTLEII